REGAIPSAPASRPSRAGVVPQGSHALQTRTQKVVASLQREWKYTLACVGTCLLLGATALWLGQLGHTVLAILVALVILPVSFSAIFVRRAPCPQCGTPVIIIGIDRCSHCHEYLRVDGDRLKPVELGFIAEYPTFVLDVPIPL